MGIAEVFGLLGGLALFLHGMQMMGAGLEAAAGNRMKQILERLTANRILGVAVGAGITAAIQSSSATTVMVVGFVNSGLMSLQQAVWIIMGANIGTTVTSQLIALDVGAMAPLFAFIGVALVMVSALTYALYIVFLNRARLELSVAKLTFYALLFGLPFILGHEALGGRFVPQPLVSPGMALWALMLGFVPTVLSLVLMAEAVRRVGETPTALLGALEPLTALAIGFLFFGEALTVRATLGVALILGAVALITLLPAAPKCHRRRA